MLFRVDEMFNHLLDNLNARVKIELQKEGWAVIIDGEVYSWLKTKEQAYDVALKLMEMDIYEHGRY